MVSSFFIAFLRPHEKRLLHADSYAILGIRLCQKFLPNAAMIFLSTSVSVTSAYLKS